MTQELSSRLLKTCRQRELVGPGDRLAVAVSGGADSVALLLLLLELHAEFGIVLSIAHVNHKLRGAESDEDERFVAAIAQREALDLHVCAAPLERGKSSGIEVAARELRYRFFRQIANEQGIKKFATAHTLDDQAETVVLRMFRGTGVRGLAGIHPRLLLNDRGGSVCEVVRPLLDFRRSELEDFLRERGQSWREDSTNRDVAFLRNRVRHNVLPRLKETFGAKAVENLADLAEIARAEEEHWNLAHPEIKVPKGSSVLSLASLLRLPVAAQRRMIRGWLAESAELNVSFRVIEEVRALARSESGKRFEMPKGHAIRRTQAELLLESRREPYCDHYEYRLATPGGVEVVELGIRIEASMVDPSKDSYLASAHLLDPQRLPGELTVRNWRAGDRFWPAHTKSEKKVKQLLGDRHISGAEKKVWPVAVAEGFGLVWMRGFPTPSLLQPSPASRRALRITESPLKR